VHKLYLDPAVLKFEAGAPSYQGRQWLEFVEWTTDVRLVTSPGVWSVLNEHYQSVTANPSEHMPTGMSKVIHGAFLRILTRSPRSLDTIDPTPTDFNASYAGGPRNKTALLAGTPSSGPAELASRQEAWPTKAEEEVVSALPQLQPAYRLHFEPNSPSRDEIRERRRKKMSGTRVLIVGGQRDNLFIQGLESETGINPGDVAWLASEKNKPPRDLDKRVTGAKQSGTILVVVTGKIGHASSGLVKRKCSTAKVPHLEVENVSDITAALIALVAPKLA
jgi:hypothetical protein